MEKVQKEGRMKRKNIKIIAGIVLLLAFAGIGAYVIISTSKQVVNIDLSGYDKMTIMCGGNGKEITPDEEQRTQIIELVKNMNLTAKKFPHTKGWSYRITYYKDGIANNIMLAGRVEWNGAEYKTDEDSYNRLIEYIDILYK